MRVSTMTQIINGGNDFYLDDEARNYIEHGADSQKEVRGIELRTVVGADVIKPMFVIVETYDHKKYGKGKREYLKTFDAEERKVISSWYLRLYAFYLRTGIPVTGVQMSINHLKILQRASNFFATI